MRVTPGVSRKKLSCSMNSPRTEPRLPDGVKFEEFRWGGSDFVTIQIVREHKGTVNYMDREVVKKKGLNDGKVREIKRQLLTRLKVLSQLSEEA